MRWIYTIECSYINRKVSMPPRQILIYIQHSYDIFSKYLKILRKSCIILHLYSIFSIIQLVIKAPQTNAFSNKKFSKYYLGKY